MVISEELANRRRRLMLWNGISFAIWQTGMLGGALAQGSAIPFFIAASLAGALIWIVSLIALLARRADSAVHKALDDELTQHNRHLAMRWGYWSMLLTAAAALGVSMFFDISATDAARMLLIVGVTTPIVRFAWLERVDASDE